MTKEDSLMQLWAEVKAALKGKKLVFGEGSVEAGLAIVGEAPGREEEEAGSPFVGRAGRWLNELLRELGLKRQEIWITNVLKWRPTLDGGGGTTRSPKTREAEQGAQWLRRELKIVGCQLVLGLGNTAARTLVSKDFKMNAQHGRWHQGRWGHEVLVTYHPAYLLRQKRDDQEKILHWMREDIQRLREEYATQRARFRVHLA